MPRIRSLHPSLWTDEAFVQLSLAARLFMMGLWNEADDYGLFAWKPTRLKMRLAPADNLDPEKMLEELMRFGFVLRHIYDGKTYGVVKNFRKYQRPKHASAPLIPLDDTLRREIGLGHEEAFPPMSPKHRAEEGGKRKEIRDKMEESHTPPSDPAEMELDGALKVWNDLAAELGLAEVQKLTDARKAKLRLRLNETQGLGGWAEALLKIRHSRFLRGETKEGWRVSFDFLLQEAAFLKLREGAYDDKTLDSPMADSTPLLAVSMPNDLETRLQQAFSRHELRTWFRDAVFQDEGHRIIVPTVFIREWIVNHFEARLTAACGFLPEISVREAAHA